MGEGMWSISTSDIIDHMIDLQFEMVKEDSARVHLEFIRVICLSIIRSGFAVSYHCVVNDNN